MYFTPDQRPFNGVLTPDTAVTQLLQIEPVTGMEWKKLEISCVAPREIISWLTSTGLALAVGHCTRIIRISFPFQFIIICMLEDLQKLLQTAICSMTQMRGMMMTDDPPIFRMSKNPM